ncbi:MAG: thrombospondin type 3 repeat-containing protein, partial [Burkholderiaceae bacterium]|nr:thrombospondin type 3 repeat-containing protein [Burkholderiaceae bacterium]
LGMGSPDSDNDGFADNVDNCRSTPNPSQLDTDGDGIGNMCDADFNNDGNVNALDLAIFQRAFGSKAGDANYNANCDLNGDGRINALDLAIFQARFGKAPGDR